MAIDSPFKITYGTRAVGGSANDYQLHGPYTFDKSFNTLRVVFDVAVVATTYATLQNLSSALEDDFRLRDKTLKIDLDNVADPDGSSLFTFTFGTDILNTVATLSKTGDSESDRGFSRVYTCVVEGELPADDNDGLRDLEVNLDFEPGRQQIVSFRGTYTALSATLALAQYTADFTAEASTILTALDSTATWELVQEQVARDRNDHLANFTRQYVQLLEKQTKSALNDTSITDHNITFSDQSSHPGDSQEGIFRFRRVIGTYDCAAVVPAAAAVGTAPVVDLQSIYDTKIFPQIKALFVSNFKSQQFGIEDQRASFDETAKRISASMTFIYQASGGGDIVDIQETLAFREQRTIDQTPVHTNDELAQYVDVGFGSLVRVATRAVIVVGEEKPRRRIFPIGGGKKGSAGEIVGIEATSRIKRQGWNLLTNTSQAATFWIGDPGEPQIETTVLTETVVESFTRLPKKVATTGPTTPVGAR